MNMNIYIYIYSANPTSGGIFEITFKTQSSKLERLFSLKRGKKGDRASSFVLRNSIRKCHPSGTDCKYTYIYK